MSKPSSKNVVCIEIPYSKLLLCKITSCITSTLYISNNIEVYKT